MAAVFPQRGEVWADCWICGFTYPMSQLVRHFKYKKLVDMDCADEMSQMDILAKRRRAPETSEQPVANQGQSPDLYEDQDVYGGAGIGGAGEGGPGGPGVGQD